MPLTLGAAGGVARPNWGKEMNSEQYMKKMNYLRQHNPSIWVTIISNNRTETLARHLAITITDAKLMKLNAPRLPFDEFIELRRYALKIRHELNQQTSKLAKGQEVK